MESKGSYLKALDLHHKLTRHQLDLVLKAMDGYGDYRARLAKNEACVHPYSAVIGEEHGLPECLSCGKKLY